MHDEFDHDLSDNPTLESVTVLIGEELAAKLSSDFGGVRLHIPMRPGPHSPITASIGMSAARTVAEIYGGMRMQVPISLGKQIKIRKLLEQGKLSIPKIALKVGCTERHVYKVKAKPVNANPTMSLFSD